MPAEGPHFARESSGGRPPRVTACTSTLASSTATATAKTLRRELRTWKARMLSGQILVWPAHLSRAASRVGFRMLCMPAHTVQ